MQMFIFMRGFADKYYDILAGISCNCGFCCVQVYFHMKCGGFKIHSVSEEVDVISKGNLHCRNIVTV